MSPPDLQAFAQGLSQQIGADYFRSVGLHLAEMLAADIVLIGKVEEDFYEIDAVTVVLEGRVVPNFRIGLSGTPCENLLNRTGCFYPSGVAKLFPKATLITQFNIEGYAGIPILGSSGQVLGLLITAFRNPISNLEGIRSALEIFSGRLGAEMQRKVAEDQVRVNEVRFRAVFENVSDVVTVMASSGTILQQNSAVERLAGFSPGEWIGTTLLDWIHPDDVPAVSAAFDALARKTLSEFSHSVRLKAQRGQWKSFEIKMRRSPIGFEVDGFIATLRDQSEREELTRKLDAYSKKEKRVNWTPVHRAELERILRNAGDQAELIQRSSTLPSDVSRRLQNLRDQAARGLALLDEITGD